MASSSTSDVWFVCGDCDNNLVRFDGLVKELVSHRNSESRWLLFRDNAGLNVKFDGRRAIDQAPASVTSMQVKDEGRTTKTDMADIRCSNCDGHVGWKIIRERNHHPVVHQGQFILRSFYRDSWERQIFAPAPRNKTDGKKHG